MHLPNIGPFCGISCIHPRLDRCTGFHPVTPALKTFHRAKIERFVRPRHHLGKGRKFHGYLSPIPSICRWSWRSRSLHLPLKKLRIELDPGIHHQFKKWSKLIFRAYRSLYTPGLYENRTENNLSVESWIFGKRPCTNFVQNSAGYIFLYKALYCTKFAQGYN